MEGKRERSQVEGIREREKSSKGKKSRRGEKEREREKSNRGNKRGRKVK